MARLKEAIGKWASTTVGLFLCLLLTRLVFALELRFRMGMEWQQPLPVLSGSWQDLFPTAFIGIIVLVPFVLIYLWLPKLAKGLYVAVIVLFVLLTASLYEYYCNMNMPLDHVIFVYSTSDMTDIVKTSVTLGFSQVFWFLLTLFAMVLVLVMLRRWTMRLYLAIALVVVAAVLLLSVNYRKIIRKEKLYGSYEEFCLAVNQVSYSYVKITDYLRESRKINTYGSAEEEAVYAAAKRYQALHGEFSFPDTEYPFCHRNTDEDVIGHFFNKTTDGLPPNFVFFIIEGFGQHLTMADNPQLSFTPFIDSLKHEGLYWKNCLSTAERTFGAIPSIFASTPYGNKGFAFFYDMIPEHRSLLTDMKRNGYTSEYFYGVIRPTDRYDSFLQHNLVDYIYQPEPENVDSVKYAYMIENNRWGLDDRELFEYVEQYRTAHPAARPHTDIVMTITTHEPFCFDGIEEYEQRVRDIVKKTANVTPTERKTVLDNTNIFACFAYMDDCVRDLIGYYSTLPEYENTIFVITGDHRTAQLHYSSIVKYNVPLLIWSPLLKESKTMDAVTSHLCITPTLNAYLSHNYDYQTSDFSHWLAPVVDTASEFRNTLKQAFMLNNRDVTQYVSGEYYISESNLYKLRDGMNTEPCNNDTVYDRLKAELADFDMLSRYAVHGNKLLNGRNDFCNVVVDESNVEKLKVGSGDEFTRLIVTDIDENLSIIDVSVQFDVQSSDTLRPLPSMVVCLGDFYHKMNLVSPTGRPLNTGEKEFFRTNVVIPIAENAKKGQLRVYLWNTEKNSATCSDVRINILGYDPTIKKLRK